MNRYASFKKNKRQNADKQPPLIPIIPIRIDRTKKLEKLIDLRKHFRQIAGKQPPLTHLTHDGIETEKRIVRGRNRQNFSKRQYFLFGVHILHIRLDSKITLNSAFEL